MGQQSFSIDAQIDAVIGREGGYSNNPADKGGPTNWGITQQVARAHGYTGDMRNLSRERAAQIYHLSYWIEPNFSAVALRYPALAAELFDIGVNMGVVTAGTFLQRALNVFNQNGAHYADLVKDGNIARITLLALDAFRQRRGDEGGDRLLEAVQCQRGVRYIEISEATPSNEAFTYGWFGRMVDMLKARFAA